MTPIKQEIEFFHKDDPHTRTGKLAVTGEFSDRSKVGVASALIELAEKISGWTVEVKHG